jgi:hypothetical protein
MKKLLECIKKNTLHNREEIENSIVNMLCIEDSPVLLSEETLLSALELEGEFLVLKLHYSDFKDEIESEKIKYKISQSLSVVVSYEDDGRSFENIKKFVNYIYNISDEKQNSIFGVKSVEKLSEFPITILFSGILPINQLQMKVGREIDRVIHSDDEYFLPRFQRYRDDISKELGIPILPVLPILDEDLGVFQVQLIDLVDGKLIAEFQVENSLSKDTIEIYLLKLFYIYKILVEEKKCSTLNLH